jgi:ketosteroid isomerase-like protein
MGFQENRQLIADAYSAFFQGDAGPLLDMMSEDVVFNNHAPAAAPTSGVFLGKDGVQKFFALVAETFDIGRFDVKKIVGDDDVVAIWIDWLGTIKRTGKSYEGPVVQWFTFRDGKVAAFDEWEHDTHDAWS